MATSGIAKAGLPLNLKNTPTLYDGYEHVANSHINRLRSKIGPDMANPKYTLTTREDTGWRRSGEGEGRMAGRLGSTGPCNALMFIQIRAPKGE